jgi:hypothetical protein
MDANGAFQRSVDPGVIDPAGGGRPNGSTSPTRAMKTICYSDWRENILRRAVELAPHAFGFVQVDQQNRRVNVQ